ncbi:MAG: isochorismatase family protein [Candidatus Bathyarchaeota archaeon]|nr:isochorismatase family protein [Candidatus Bathyarchaeota archaeon]
MRNIVFWDVDTQIDFIEPTGKLYVSEAEMIKANLAYLTEMGAIRGRLSGSVDAHTPNDNEFREWTEHCVYGTLGQHKIPESTVKSPLFVPSVKLSIEQLSEVAAYEGQVIFEKQDTDVRTNPNVKHFMNLIRPKMIVIYGVVTEICVNLAVDFFARDLGYETVVVVDAIKEIDLSKADSCKAEWKALGVEMLRTRDVESILGNSA